MAGKKPVEEASMKVGFSRKDAIGVLMIIRMQLCYSKSGHPQSLVVLLAKNFGRSLTFMIRLRKINGPELR